MSADAAISQAITPRPRVVTIAPPIVPIIPKPPIRTWVVWGIVLAVTNAALWWFYLAPNWKDLPGI